MSLNRFIGDLPFAAVAIAMIATVPAKAVILLNGDTVAESFVAELSLNPRATYLRTNDDLDALDAVAIDLAALGINGGQLLSLKVLGEYQAGDSIDGFADTSRNVVGVFSTSGTLLASSNQVRVPDAVRDPNDGSSDRITLSTFNGGLSTDIAQDFRLRDSISRVPTLGTNLFISVDDSLFGDNLDPDNDLKVALSTPRIVGSTGAGSLTIDNIGATTTLSGGKTLVLGADTGSSGILTVDGAGAVLSLESGIRIGNNGTGVATIQNGGVVNTQFVSTGRATGGDGALIVTGPDSVLNLVSLDANPVGGAAFLSSGRNAAGTVEVSAGGKIIIDGNGAAFAGFQAGRNLGSDGTITVTGANSELALNGPDAFVRIGGTGTGALNVLGGGKVTVLGLGGVDRFDIGQNAGGNGAVTVDGAGSILSVQATNSGSSNSSNIAVGRAGTGSLNIANGGVVEGLFLSVGRLAGSVGNLTVDGAGSSLKLAGEDSTGQGAFLTVARFGKGTLDVTNGAQITITDLPGSVFTGFQAGRDDGGDGTINVSGPGSAIIVTSGEAGFSQIGRSDGSTGALNITAGGKVLNNATSVNFIGRKTGATGSVLVSGAGSEFDGGAFIGVGVDFDQVTSGGTGTLTVENGGVVRADTIAVGGNGVLKGAGGTVNANVVAFDGGTIAPGSSPGTLIINGDLIIDTGILQLETEGGISDELIVSGTVQVGENAIIELFFDTLAGVVDLDDFFTFGDPNDAIEFAANFNGSGISIFTSDQDFVDDELTVVFGGSQVILAASFGVSSTPVPEPGAMALFGIGLVGLVAIRRRRRITA